MSIIDTQHKRKSAAITIIILMLLVWVILKFGMTYLDPPEEYGVAINFGTSDIGRGEPVEKVKEIIPKKTAKQVVEEIEKPIEDPVKEVIEEVKETPKEVVEKDVLTDETVKDDPAVKKVEEKKIPKKEVPKKVEPKKEPKPKPKPSKATQDALNKLLNGNSSDGAENGEGDDENEGVKGKEDGDEVASKYYGKEGSGLDGNYNLAGRKALSKPKEQPDCEEEGTVVVRIEVDKNGKVISAIPGVKGSTSTAPCLLKPARTAALSTKWNADKNAPSKQTGTIIYKFTLTK